MANFVDNIKIGMRGEFSSNSSSSALAHLNKARYYCRGFHFVRALRCLGLCPGSVALVRPCVVTYSGSYVVRAMPFGATRPGKMFLVALHWNLGDFSV